MWLVINKNDKLREIKTSLPVDSGYCLVLNEVGPSRLASAASSTIDSKYSKLKALLSREKYLGMSSVALVSTPGLFSAFFQKFTSNCTQCFVSNPFIASF